jgi:hypothetical protein
MRDKTKTFWFGIKVTALVLAIPFLFILLCVGCSRFDSIDTIHYYKIERINNEGKVQQTYISKGHFPWVGEHYVDFREYPSGHLIRINSAYTVEDLGETLDQL